MKTIFILVYSMFTLVYSSFGNKPGDDKNCKIMHEGTFKYKGDDDVVVKIKGGHQTEAYNKGKYIIESDLVWVNDCEYNMTMTKITLPDFPYKKGDTMNVKINKVDGKNISYTATVKGKSWDGTMIKQK